MKKGSILHEWQKRGNDGGKCSRCGRESYPLTVDHIIPDFLLRSMALQEERYGDNDNFELLCKPCNTLKRGNLDLNNPKTIPLLEKYVALVKERYQVKL